MRWGAARRHARLVLVPVVMLGAATVGLAQEGDFPIQEDLLRRMGLVDQEIAALQQIDAELRQTARLAQVELEILRAQLKKALLPLEPDMGQVEELLRSVMQWELQARMAQIQRQVRIRQLLGDERFARITQAFRRRQAEQRQRQPEASPRAGRSGGQLPGGQPPGSR